MKKLFSIDLYSAIFCFGITLILFGCGSGSSSTPTQPVTLNSITITPGPIFIGFNSTHSLKATGTYSDNSTADLSSKVTWTSDNSSVNVSSLGVVTGSTSTGVALITATLSGVNSSVTVTVVDGPLTNLHVARYDHAATLLTDGSVLVTGGYGAVAPALGSVELYDPIQGLWTVNYTGLSTVRGDHTATLLVNPNCTASFNCKVLVAGGSYDLVNDATSAELYDPSTKTWTVTGYPITPRTYHTATLLSDGRVLLAGGSNSVTGTTVNSEIYDPATGLWTATNGTLATRRYSHTATLLNDGTGRVLVVGGFDDSTPAGVALATAELFNPISGTWTTTGSLGTGRYSHTATLLSNGTVLVVGGTDTTGNDLASAEIYDPASELWTSLGVGSLTTARYNHTATLLSATGQVLVVGGTNLGNPSIPSSELYDPILKTWSPPIIVTARVTHTATQLKTGPNTGKVLVVGGDGNAGLLSSSELLN